MVKFGTEKDEHPPAVFLWGGPGIGKSAIIRQVVEELGMDPEESFIDLRLTQLDPVDLRGLPRLESEDYVEWATPHFLPREGEGVLFLDELNLAPGAVQNAAYQLILDRRLGDYELPNRWVMIAAGNRAEDRAGVNPMKAPLSNRFVHWEVETDLEDWKDWAYDKGIDHRVIGFLNFKPGMLYRFDREKGKHAFPTPRTWERVSDLLEMGLTATGEIGSAVGLGAAREFKAYIRMGDELPDAEAVLEGKDEVPEEPDRIHALVSSMVQKGADREGFEERIVEYANLLPAEFAVLLVKDALRAGIPIQTTEQFQEFSERHKDLILGEKP
ncbi:hypothetical protein AKJ41_04685 [candidate division MSBL1 archaeon SCGC-AAA259O05]|uniref:ATPase dynein-related AAA domain-containing protein n=1 Tax=candidate division MSBL1 archaeon SCGC-AAA259O05 TaxID=1698271 RepID=A0A133V0D9_9EURY|nr:hypothetical protein AKJ41_04685 [candidate division MSBL1 archaeon SCGC-AAA259O05]